MMRALGLATLGAGDKVHRSDEDMPAAIALAMAADTLLGKRSHDRCSPALILVGRPKQSCQSRKLAIHFIVVAALAELWRS